MEQTKPGLTANTLKWIAIIAMTVDHIAWLFVPFRSPAGQIMHVIGRMTIPIMSFFIVEGYHHTKSVVKYLLRLFIFAAISHLPFLYFETRTITFLYHGEFYTSVIYTLFIALLALVVVKSEALHIILRFGIVTGLVFLANYGDWMYFPVLWVVCFGLLREHKSAAFLAAAAVSCSIPFLLSPGNLYQLGTLLAFPLLWMYDGRIGKKGYKYFFYIYYPVHLVLITLFYRYLYVKA